MKTMGHIVTGAYILTLLGCRASNQSVTKEFNTPGAVVAAYSDPDTGKREADTLLQQFVAALARRGSAPETSNWTWDYYAYDKVVWSRSVFGGGQRITCNVVQGVGSNVWALSVSPFPLGPRSASPEARNVLTEVLGLQWK